MSERDARWEAQQAADRAWWAANNAVHIAQTHNVPDGVLNALYFSLEKANEALAAVNAAFAALPPPDGKVPPVKFYGGPPHTRPGRWTGNR